MGQREEATRVTVLGTGPRRGDRGYSNCTGNSDKERGDRRKLQ